VRSTLRNITYATTAGSAMANSTMTASPVITVKTHRVFALDAL
jgi:hypothetical protein